MVALALVGHSEYDIGISAAAAGDEYLGAVHDVGAVLLLDSNGLLCSGVGACVRSVRPNAPSLAPSLAVISGRSHFSFCSGVPNA